MSLRIGKKSLSSENRDKLILQVHVKCNDDNFASKRVMLWCLAKGTVFCFVSNDCHPRTNGMKRDVHTNLRI